MCKQVRRIVCTYLRGIHHNVRTTGSNRMFLGPEKKQIYQNLLQKKSYWRSYRTVSIHKCNICVCSRFINHPRQNLQPGGLTIILKKTREHIQMQKSRLLNSLLGHIYLSDLRKFPFLLRFLWGALCKYINSIKCKL